MESIMKCAFAMYFLIVSGAVPALADTRSDIEAGIIRCRPIGDDRVWLDCVYGAAQPMRAKLGLPPAPQANMSFPTTPQPHAMTSSDSLRDQSNAISRGEAAFGLASRPVQEAGISRITSQMISYRFDRTGVFTVTLANGQTWQQESGDTTLAKWTKLPSSYIAEISRGALGSFNLRIADLNGSYKVSRTR
jgi:hypothetical protein